MRTLDVHDPGVIVTLPQGPDVVTVALQCQDSSRVNANRSPNSFKHDTGERMVLSAIALDPKVIVAETVEGFLDYDERVNNILRLFASGRYTTSWYVINALAWVPTNRRRLFLVASRVGNDLLKNVYEHARDAPPTPLSSITARRSWR